MAEIRVLAIEDEPLHAEKLRITLEEAGFVVIDIVADVSVFKRLLKATVPDIILVDIDLGEAIDGIELVKDIANTSDTPFIFLTSHHDSATVARATESLPAAYLTKPFSVASLSAAIEIAVNALDKRPTTIANPVSTGVFVKSGEKLLRIHTEDLLLVEAQNKQCKLTLNNDVLTVTAKITDLVQKLPAQFVQTHRSFIVNLDKVEAIDSQYKNLTINKVDVPIGRNYKHGIMEKLLKLG